MDKEPSSSAQRTSGAPLPCMAISTTRCLYRLKSPLPIKCNRIATQAGDPQDRSVRTRGERPLPPSSKGRVDGLHESFRALWEFDDWSQVT